jgi:hypothetical protein
MTEEEKSKIIAFIREKLSPEEAELVEGKIRENEFSKEILNDYRKMIRHIDLVYAGREIKNKTEELHFSEDSENDDKNKNTEKAAMISNKKPWVHYLITIATSILVSWLVFTIAFNKNEEKNIYKEEASKIESTDLNTESNEMVTDVVDDGLDIMGIAINRTGFYILPYSINERKSVFGSNQNMTNNLPITIIWDDKELGLAIVTFVDENLNKLPSIPYRFSKDDFFLGEEMFLVFSSKTKMNVNRGMVIKDNPESTTMTLHLTLEGNVYGAVVMDKKGVIVGICEEQDENGNAEVIKSMEIYKMIEDMNLDKGVPYIAMPNSTIFKLKSNPQRIELLSPFVAWFNSK